jgi:hypothetical protein
LEVLPTSKKQTIQVQVKSKQLNICGPSCDRVLTVQVRIHDHCGRLMLHFRTLLWLLLCWESAGRRVLNEYNC